MLVEHVAGLLLVVGLLLAVDRQRILPRLDREISVGEAGDCNRDAIGVLAGPLAQGLQGNSGELLQQSKTGHVSNLPRPWRSGGQNKKIDAPLDARFRQT
jgi:hypothetical protein